MSMFRIVAKPGTDPAYIAALEALLEHIEHSDEFNEALAQMALGADAETAAARAFRGAKA